ncbi:SPFH domain-containing protein [Microbacterium sp. LWO12-1.2]|uniref:SPFH domain-containing protein n=1 Tax=Microbacterium sp. LWO12-1.2 TaxID=3135261 RepID=UPI00343D2C63
MSVDAIFSMFGGGAMGGLVKTGTAVLTVLLVIPALLKLFIITVDEGWAAIRTRNGKPIIRRARLGKPGAPGVGEVVVLAPGSHGAFPLFYWYKLIDVRCRATDLPARQLTGASGHQHLVHASFEWRPLASGRDLRVFELDVVNVTERAANIISASLRDVIRSLDGAELPHNDVLSVQVLAACNEKVIAACGVEVVNVMITGDALTDGYLLSQALLAADSAPQAVAALHALN